MNTRAMQLIIGIGAVVLAGIFNAWSGEIFINLNEVLNAIERWGLLYGRPCQMGDQRACARYEQWGQLWDQAQQSGHACQQGNDAACQRIAQIANALGVGINQPPGPNPSPHREPRRDTCSRCEIYQTRESNCGKDCSYIDPYGSWLGSQRMHDCTNRAAQCRADASRAFEQCLDQCRGR